MASEEKKQSKKHVFDVAKPGKTPAEASSRPIIVTHKPLVEDPMVTKTIERAEPTSKPSGEAAAPAAEIVNHTGKTVETLHNELEETQDTEEKPEKSDEVTDATISDPESNEEAKNEAHGLASAEISVAAEELDQKSARQEAEAKQSQQEIELREKVSKLIEEKKYFVKVGESRKHKSTSTGIILLVLLLVVVGLYLAVDGELIKTDITLPYDFIK